MLRRLVRWLFGSCGVIRVLASVAGQRGKPLVFGSGRRAPPEGPLLVFDQFTLCRRIQKETGSLPGVLAPHSDFPSLFVPGS